MKYTAIPKVGTRNRVWLIVNEHGGLLREFPGTKRQAENAARRATSAAESKQEKHS